MVSLRWSYKSAPSTITEPQSILADADDVHVRDAALEVRPPRESRDRADLYTVALDVPGNQRLSRPALDAVHARAAINIEWCFLANFAVTRSANVARVSR